MKIPENKKIEPSTAIAENTVNVFISYIKKRDFTLANDLATELRVHSAGKVKPFVAHKDTPIGEVWENWIRDSIANSHLLILLFTDPDEDWRWCFYEAGMFRGYDIGKDNHRGVICIYQPDNEPPAPLSSIQAVPATITEIKQRFLIPFFKDTRITKTAKPLNEYIDENTTLHNIATSISTSFEKKTLTPHPALPEVVFEIVDPEIIKNNGLPDNTDVTPNDLAGVIFDIPDGKWNWGELRAAIKSTSSAWSDELSRAISQATERRTPDPITATFRIGDSGKIFRPIVYRLDRVGRRLLKCHVLFNQEKVPRSIGGPRRSGRIFNLLRISTRLRWEVIEHYSEQIKTNRLPQAPEVFYNQMKDSLNAIEDDERETNSSMSDIVADLFDSEDQKLITEAINLALKVRSALRDAILKNDLSVIQKQLDEMRETTAVLQSLFANRYVKLIDAE